MPCNAETCSEDEDEEGVKEEESPAFNMILPSAELGRLWLVILLLLFTFESLLDDILQKGRADLRGRLDGGPVSLKFSRCRVDRLQVKKVDSSKNLI